MAKYLQQARSRFDWSRNSTGDHSVAGMSGNKAALIIASEMGRELSDDTNVATISGNCAMLGGGTAGDQARNRPGAGAVLRW